MIRVLIIICVFFCGLNINAQCTAPISLYTTNVFYYSADANWTPTTSDVNYYRIRYKEVGSSSWQFINNIDSSLNSKIISGLNSLSYYVWQIKTYCDTINTNNSSWSIEDTFYTATTLCPNTSTLYTTNINYNNAQANWDTVSGADRYKIRYKILGTTNWSNLGPFHHPLNNALIPLLQQSTSYEWQVQTFHDTSAILGSLWSESDTFTTGVFVPAPFNPIINNSLSTLECNATADLFLSVTQANNEPDVGTSTITSDKGSFNISAMSFGDTIGYATTTTSVQTITGILTAGVVLGQNYAIINSYDSTGSLIGFFSIENDNGGIKVSSSSPNDGNNYTSGYVSNIFLNNIFINPPFSGPMHFYVDINSELNDQINLIDTMQVWCNTTNLSEQTLLNKRIISIVDLLGKEKKQLDNKMYIIKYSDGSTEKRITIK
tara:strand:+ start:337931 stop:339232 length:1302 start_codon:yes stop_codon:yes gene_type:complete